MLSVPHVPIRSYAGSEKEFKCLKQKNIKDCFYATTFLNIKF